MVIAWNRAIVNLYYELYIASYCRPAGLNHFYVSVIETAKKHSTKKFQAKEKLAYADNDNNNNTRVSVVYSQYKALHQNVNQSYQHGGH